MSHQAISSVAEKLLSQKYGAGWNIDYHVIEGSPIYAKLFAAFAKLIDRHEHAPFWVYKRAIATLTNIPPRAYGYALFKFESEDYFHTSSTKIFVNAEQLENWDVLAEKVSARLGEKP